jgi:hypothetical protein
MAADCLDHVCSEREYRAGIVKSKVDIAKKFEQKCKGIMESAIFSEIIDKLNKTLDDAKEEVRCPNKCKCKMGNWPKDKNGQEIWEKLERDVTYVATYVEPISGCEAKVTITYDYESRERRGKCYKRPPT